MLDRKGSPAHRRLFAACLLLSVALVAADEDTSASLGLVPGVSIERPLGPGNIDRFQLELAAGKHWLITVEQIGIDVVLEIRDPRGRSLLIVDGPLGSEGNESLLLTPEVDGWHSLEVRCEQEGIPDGRYRVSLEQLPAATDTDILRLRAEAAMTDAGRLNRESGANKESGVNKEPDADARESMLASLREALEIWRGLGERRRQASTLHALGKVFARHQDHRQSADNYALALALRRELNSPRALAATLGDLGVAHIYLGEPPKAIDFLEEAAALRQQLGQREREADIRNELCLAFQRSGRFQAAGECYRQVLNLAKEIEHPKLEARVLNNLGGVFQSLAEPTQALEFFQLALAKWQSLGDEPGAATTLNNLGVFHRRLGEIEQALLYYNRALTIFEGLEDRYWLARTLNNIAVGYLTLGELERARAYLLRGLPVRRAVGDKSGESVTLRNLGLTFSRLGELGKAVAFYRKALDLDSTSGNRRGVATSRKLLGEHLAAQGDVAAAREQLELALTSLRQMGKRGEEPEVLERLSRVHLRGGDPRAARTAASRALELYRELRSRLGQVTALTLLARAERELGRHEAAHEYLATALDVLDELHGRLGDPTQRASFLASQREVYELTVDLLMERHRRSPAKGHDLAALEASERGRSRSLLGWLDNAGAGLERGVEPALRERLRDAERRFTAKTRQQLRVLGREHTPAEALGAEQELYAALAELDSARAEVRRRPRDVARDRPPTLDSSTIRHLLDERTVLLEFLLGEERSFLWWVTPASVAAYELPPRAAIEELAGRVYRLVSTIHSDIGATREASAALGQMLLGPVIDRLRDQRLVIVADGALHLVPFAALTLPSSRQPLVERHEIAHLPSASVLAWRRRGAGARPSTPATIGEKTLAILADPIFDRRDPRIAAGTSSIADLDTATRQAAVLELDRLGRLPQTRHEAEAIAALVPADQRLVATGSDARRARVVGGELGAYRILHFATHGFIHPHNPELSGLVLARLDGDGGRLDGFLGLHDVSNLELSAELVVLSGCRTALGKQLRGEGLVGLTRGFMVAGVPRVVASLWQVRDTATAELMARFYRAMLVDGLAPAAALRPPQLSLRQERRFRAPFFWAAFTLQGEWR